MNEVTVKKQKSRVFFNILFLCCLFRNTVVYALLLVAGKLPLIGGYKDLLYTVFIIWLIIMALPEFRRLDGKDIAFVFFVAFSILFSMLIGDDEYLRKNLKSLIFSVYPFYFLGRNFDCHDEVIIGKKSYRMEDVIYVLSAAGIVLMFAMQWYSLMRGSYNRILENSSGATQSKFLLGFCCFYMFKHWKLHSVLIVVFGFLAMFSYANRTSLLAVFIIFIVASLYYLNLKEVRSFLLLIAEISAAGIIIIRFKTIISVIGNLLYKLGFNVRIVNMLLGTSSQSIFYGNGREFLFSDAIDIMNSEPIWGYGLYADRNLFGKATYVHNLFLELIIDYGWITGIILSLLVVILIAKGIIAYRNDKDTLSFFLVIGISEITMLVVSGSYLQEGFFFMLLGMSLTKRKSYSLGGLPKQSFLPKRIYIQNWMDLK